jgi:RNA polymerase-binding transcription factor DksA
MSKTKTKSKIISKGKAKKSAPVKKNVKKPAAKAKAAKPVKKKAPVKAKASAPKKKVAAPAKAKSNKSAKPVSKGKKEVSKKVILKTAAPVAAKPVISNVAKPVKKQTPPVTEKKTEVPKDNPPKNRPSVARPIPVNRRPEPARAIISNSKPQEETGKNRYSDAELEEFRDIINKKLKDARKELALLQAQMTASNDHGTDDTASTFKILEDGSDSLAKEEAGQLAGRQKKFIEQLENAMVRIENKTYGICRVTGKLIPKERLRAVPHTTQSIEAKLNQYRD